MQPATSIINNRDYVVIIDKSGSMDRRDTTNGLTRWQAAAESTYALVAKVLRLDPDGIDIYLFSDNFVCFKGINDPEKVNEIFTNQKPGGTTALHLVLEKVLHQYRKDKRHGKFEKKAGETILVITDGEPDDQDKVKKVIIKAANRIEKDSELAISFIQVGKDKKAAEFLKSLDDDLKGNGAKHDIVDTVKMDDIEEKGGLTQVLLDAIND